MTCTTSSCLLFWCLARLGASELLTCEGSECNPTELLTDVIDEQGINMLQLKGAKMAMVTEDAAPENSVKHRKGECPVPETPRSLPHGKGCPPHGTCLNGNTIYDTLEEAWLLCAEVDGCGAILENADGKFLLRRASDPDMPQTDPDMSRGVGSKMIVFGCPAQADIGGKVATQVETAKQIHVGHASAPSKMKEVAAHAYHANLNRMYAKSKDMLCGWDDNDVKCQMDNQAYINAGDRNKPNVAREHAMHACGRICAEAGSECAGFVWQAATKSCHFRKNASCGHRPAEGIDCFQKKMRFAQSLLEE